MYVFAGVCVRTRACIPVNLRAFVWVSMWKCVCVCRPKKRPNHTRHNFLGIRSRRFHPAQRHLDVANNLENRKAISREIMETDEVDLFIVPVAQRNIKQMRHCYKRPGERRKRYHLFLSSDTNANTHTHSYTQFTQTHTDLSVSVCVCVCISIYLFIYL